MTKNKFWERCERTLLAEYMCMPSSNLSEILHRKRTVSKEKAMQLEHTTEQLLCKNIPWHEWIFNKESSHPAFFGEPQGKLIIKKQL